MAITNTSTDISLLSEMVCMRFELSIKLRIARPKNNPSDIYIVDQTKLLIASKVKNFNPLVLLNPITKMAMVLNPYKNRTLNIAQ